MTDVCSGLQSVTFLACICPKYAIPYERVIKWTWTEKCVSDTASFALANIPQGAKHTS